jgi:hypothetical protein
MRQNRAGAGKDREPFMNMISHTKGLIANYAFSIREVRSWDSRNSFIVSEIPEELWDDLLLETANLPVGNSGSHRDVKARWRDIGAARGDWQAAISAEADFLNEEGISAGPTFYMITNYSYAEGLAAPEFNGRLVRALCLCDEFGRLHYTDVASGSQGIGGVVAMESKHDFKDVVTAPAPRKFADQRITKAVC